MKKIIIALLSAMAVIGMTGCANTGPKDYAESTSLRIKKTEFSDLYYDTETRIVYFIFNENHANVGFGYMSPYIAPNGLPYRYVDNKLVEIS